MAYYKELREQVAALEEAGKLVRVKREINKDTELHPLVRLQFRGLPEAERKAFSSKMSRMPGGGNTRLRARGVTCGIQGCLRDWPEVQAGGDPAEVGNGPEEPHPAGGRGKAARRRKRCTWGRPFWSTGARRIPDPHQHAGVRQRALPDRRELDLERPGNGIRNVGNYRGMIKSATRIGILNVPSKDLRTMWEKCRKMGKPLEAAIAIGPVPAIGYCATVRFPYEVDEMAVAGVLRASPCSS